MDRIVIEISRRGASRTCSISAFWSGDGGAPHGWRSRTAVMRLPEGSALDPTMATSLVDMIVRSIRDYPEQWAQDSLFD